MTGQELRQLFRSLVDDPDGSFFSDADIATALSLGYNEYCTYIAMQQPQLFEKAYDFTLPQLTYNMTLVTTPPTVGSVATINSTGGGPYVYNTVLGSTQQSIVNALVALAANDTVWTFTDGGLGFQPGTGHIIAVHKNPQPSNDLITVSYANTVGGTFTAVQTNTGGGELELNGILFGGNPTVGNAYRITRLYSRVPGQIPDFGYWLYACDTIEEMWNAGNSGITGVYNQARWCLQGTKLLFSAQLANTFRLYYLPAPTVNWTTAIATPGVFIDNTAPYQQLIAYWAVQAYAIRDWADNPALDKKFGQLLQELDRWLIRGRSGDSHKWVQASKVTNRGGSW